MPIFAVSEDRKVTAAASAAEKVAEQWLQFNILAKDLIATAESPTDGADVELKQESPSGDGASYKSGVSMGLELKADVGKYDDCQLDEAT